MAPKSAIRQSDIKPTGRRQMLHGSDIPLNGPLDTQQTTARGDNNGALHQDGARSATKTAKRDRVVWKRVWEKQQAIRKKSWQRLVGLRTKMAEVKNTRPMPPSYRHELNEHMKELDRMITFTEIPPQRQSLEQCAKLDAFARKEEWFYVNTFKWFAENYLNTSVVHDDIDTDIHLPVDLQTPLDLRMQAAFWSGNSY